VTPLPPQPKSTKPEYEYIPRDALIQELVKRQVDLTLGDGSLTLEVCFTRGYTGVGHSDDGTLSNRKKAECDSILKRLYQSEAAAAADEKKLDEAYDKKHQPDLKP